MNLSPLPKKKSREDEISSHKRSKSIREIDIKDQMDYDQWNSSKKMKNEI